MRQRAYRVDSELARGDSGDATTGRRVHVCAREMQAKLVQAHPGEGGNVEEVRGRGQSVYTHFPGLSRSPPLFDSSWQQQRIYRIRPSRLYRLSFAAGSAPGPSPDPPGPFKAASIRGQHPPTQWL